MKSPKKFAFGCGLMLTALWGTAVTLHYGPDWISFPSLMTGMMVFIAGAALCGLSFDV